MKTKLIPGLLCAAAVVTPACAQEGLATSSTIGGRNTIQQAPSGGRSGGAAGANGATRNNEGLSDSQQRDLERRNNAATAICKGC